MDVPDNIASGPEHLHRLLVGVPVEAPPVHLNDLVVHLHHARPVRGRGPSEGWTSYVDANDTAPARTVALYEA